MLLKIETVYYALRGKRGTRLYIKFGGRWHGGRSQAEEGVAGGLEGCLWSLLRGVLALGGVGLGHEMNERECLRLD